MCKFGSKVLHSYFIKLLLQVVILTGISQLFGERYERGWKNKIGHQKLNIPDKDDNRE